jgi:hypothetical protein
VRRRDPAGPQAGGLLSTDPLAPGDATVERESVLLLAGQLAGMAMRATAAEFAAAAEAPGLYPEYRRMVLALAEYRRAVSVDPPSPDAPAARSTR